MFTTMRWASLITCAKQPTTIWNWAIHAIGKKWAFVTDYKSSLGNFFFEASTYAQEIWKDFNKQNFHFIDFGIPKS